MSRLGRNPIYLPLNNRFEVKHFLNGNIFWLTSFVHCCTTKFDLRIALKSKKNGYLLNSDRQNCYLDFYFNKPNLLKKRRIQQISAFHIIMKQNLISTLVGYRKFINIWGLGYEFSSDMKKLVLEVGYSHKLLFFWDRSFEGTRFSRKAKGALVKNIDITKLTRFLAKIKKSRPMNLYTRKGIKYKNEFFRYKEVKKKKTS